MNERKSNELDYFQRRFIAAVYCAVAFLYLSALGYTWGVSFFIIIFSSLVGLVVSMSLEYLESPFKVRGTLITFATVVAILGWVLPLLISLVFF